MSYPIVWYKDADGKIQRSYRIESYDAKENIFHIVDPAATAEHIKTQITPYIDIKDVCFELPLSRVLFCNWEARESFQLTEIPCQVGGYGADLKAFILKDLLKAERASGAPKPAAYEKWRDSLIADVEAGPSREQIRAAYPTVRLNRMGL